ncbi:hypothetical protein [uncultured Helicobacter sp.]|nr:hypothetical protein [uncultured Helicobacter sp.]
MNLLNDSYKELNILDSLFGDLIDKHFSLKSKYFYNPQSSNEYIQAIANTFDIDIQDENSAIAIILCQKPLLKKSKLGTMQGIKEAVYPIFGEVKIHTHATKEHLNPFEFEIQIEPNSTHIIDLQKAMRLIDIYKPLRDSSKGISINLPSAQIKTETASVSDFCLDIKGISRINRTFQTQANIEIIAKWDLVF